MSRCNLCEKATGFIRTENGIWACFSCASRCVQDWWRWRIGEVPKPVPQPPPLEDQTEPLPEKVADLTSRGKY
jgi:hypothetical protein